MTMIIPPKERILTVAEKRERHKKAHQRNAEYQHWLANQQANIQAKQEQIEAETKARLMQNQLDHIRNNRYLLNCLDTWTQDARRVLLKHPQHKKASVSISVQTAIAPHAVILVKDCETGVCATVHLVDMQAVINTPSLQIVGENIASLSAVMAYTLHIANELNGAIVLQDDIALYQSIIKSVYRTMGA